ncbi:hypothetical protein V5H41_28710, partial [Salmonella enterica]
TISGGKIFVKPHFNLLQIRIAGYLITLLHLHDIFSAKDFDSLTISLLLAAEKFLSNPILTSYRFELRVISSLCCICMT